MRRTTNAYPGQKGIRARLLRASLAFVVGGVSLVSFFFVAGTFIGTAVASTFQGPTAAPPGGNIPVTIWNRYPTLGKQTGAELDIDGTVTAGASTLDLGNAAGGQNIFYGVASYTGMNAADYLALYQTYNAGVYTPRFWVGKDGDGYFSGKLGIGTSTPASPLTVAKNSIGTAKTVGSSLINTTAAANNAQQYSPIFELAGQGWGTTGGATQTVAVGMQVVPVQGTNPTAKLGFYDSINAGAYTQRLTVSFGASSQVIQSQTNDLVLYDVFNNGLVASNAVGGGMLRVAGADKYYWTGTNFRPQADGTQSLGLAANRWSAMYGGQNSIGTAKTIGLSLANKTAAANNAQQYSPLFELAGQGWGTGSGTSQAVNWGVQVRPVQGSTANADLVFFQSLNGAAYGEITALTLKSLFGATTAAFAGNAIVTDVALVSSSSTGAMVANNTFGGVSLYSGGAETVRVTGGNVGIGDTTPLAALTVGNGDLFQVDGANGNVTTAGTVKLGSLASEPSGANGLTYYNSTTNKFRCYENGAWMDCVTVPSVADGTANGQTLRWDGTAWAANTALSNDGTTVGVGTLFQIDVASGDVVTAGSIVAGGRAGFGADAAVDDGSLLYPGYVFHNLISAEESVSTTTPDFVEGIANYVSLNPTAVPSYLAYGMDSEIETAAGNARNFSLVTAGFFAANKNGSGTVSAMVGVDASANNITAGTVSDAYGVSAQVSNYGPGTIANGYGVRITAANNIGGGTFTNNYGLYVADQSAVGSGNSYNVYSQGAASKNYFEGKVGISDTTPLATLTVGNGDLFQVDGATGNILTLGSLQVNGNQTLGDASTDTTTINGLARLGLISADPTGTNGNMYYNNTTNKFRCYENGAWKNCTPSGALVNSGTLTGQTLAWNNGTTAWDASSNLFNDGAKVGIGTTAPNSFVTINKDSANGQIATLLEVSGQSLSPTVSGGGMNVAFTTAGSTTWGAVGGYSNGVRGLGLWSGVGTGAPQAYIDSAGKVGIGDTTPAATLTVGNGDLFQVDGATGDVSTAGSVKIGSFPSELSGANGRTYYNSTTNKFRCHENGAWKDCITVPSVADGTVNGQTLRWDGAAWAANTIVYNDGANVGIGTTAPNSFVTINKDSANGQIATLLEVSGQSLSPSVSGGGMNVAFTTAGSTTWGAVGGYSNGVRGLGLWSGVGTGAPQAYIDSTGRIGISDTTPLATLTVGNGDLFQVDGATGNILTLGSLQVNGNQTLGDASTDTTTINGLARLGLISADPTGTNGNMYYNNTTNKFRCYENGAWKNCTPSGALVNSGTLTGQTLAWNNGTTAWDASSNLFNDGTNVGIGTTTVSQRLVVNGNIQSTNATLGIMLNAADSPLITRGGDAFTSGGYSGLGRWGLFQETNALTIGVPKTGAKYFKIAGYNLDSTRTDWVAVDGGTGNVTTSGDLAVDGGDITSGLSTFNLLNSVASTINIGTSTAQIYLATSASQVHIGGTGTQASLLKAGGGYGDTGCTTYGLTGNLSCDGILQADGGITTAGNLNATGLSFTIANTPATVNFAASATTLNIGPTGAGATTLALAGGSGGTGCTIDGATGNFTCSGNITANGNISLGGVSKSAWPALDEVTAVFNYCGTASCSSSCFNWHAATSTCNSTTAGWKSTDGEASPTDIACPSGYEITGIAANGCTGANTACATKMFDATYGQIYFNTTSTAEIRLRCGTVN